MIGSRDVSFENCLSRSWSICFKRINSRVYTHTKQTYGRRARKSGVVFFYYLVKLNWRLCCSEWVTHVLRYTQTALQGINRVCGDYTAHFPPHSIRSIFNVVVMIRSRRGLGAVCVLSDLSHFSPVFCLFPIELLFCFIFLPCLFVAGHFVCVPLFPLSFCNAHDVSGDLAMLLSIDAVRGYFPC